MKCKTYKFPFSLFLLSMSFTMFGQQTFFGVDSVVRQINQYALTKPSATLFVHFDKNIYTNNENVWFTGYILQNNTNAVHHIMSVTLARNDDRSILAEGKYFIERGLAFGNLVLPDSLPTGNYTFICYTDNVIDNDPSALFLQPATIKSAKADGFIVDLSLRDSITTGVDLARVLLRAYKPDLTPVSKANVSYFIGERNNPLLKGKLITDKIGEAQIIIPLKEITGLNNVLQTDINNEAELKTFSLKLPVYKKETSVKFYPEGGNLVAGVKNVVGWEVKNIEGEGLIAKGILFKNDKAIQTIFTNANGIGRFILTPEPAANYYVKLEGNAGDSMYVLPGALINAPVISISNALAKDTLVMELTNANEGQLWSLLIHNYRNTYFDALIPSTAKQVRVSIPLTEVPKGLHAVTLIDSAGRPWAERIFFAHYDQKSLITISTDASTYIRRQKVKLQFKIVDARKHPVRSIVSVACVQANRLDPKNMTDIETYLYLKNELTSFPLQKGLMKDEENINYLENILLVKGWRKYSWTDATRSKNFDTSLHHDSLTYKGFVVKNDKPLKKPVQLIVANLVTSKISSVDAVDTDSSGHFILTNDKITSLSSKQVIKLSIYKNDKEDYKIKLDDPYKEMNKKLAFALPLENYRLFASSQSSRMNALPAGEVSKQMAVVVVTAKKDNSIYGYSREGANECGDYVCSFGILNCRNHPPTFAGTHSPIVGKSYGMSGGRGGGGGRIVYTGCSRLWEGYNKEYEKTIDGINKTMEFYVEDYSKNDVTGSQYLSTIYWNHAILTNTNGEAETEFYTSDITGRFRVIIQGITDKGVIFGEQVFDVEK